ncbi:MAG: amidohydrolase family protein, partial [Dehalococcoidia bacterium]|nr:amidohydrolase family protein [Dehalococcoidia bacterium]
MTAQQPTIAAVDAWAQPGTGQLINRPEFASLWRATGMSPLPEGIPIDQLIAEMDEAGIQRAVLRAWAAPEGWIITNDEIAALVQRFPDRFVGMATVDLMRPVEAVGELRRAVAD